MKQKVAIVMGSDSDLPVVEKAIRTLKKMNVGYEVQVISAHRTPLQAAEFSKSAEKNGFGVIIAAAGMAAHLAGVLAAYTILPVIGLPCKGGALDGIDALLSTVQMPPGVPVACVGLNAGVNAALLAVQILATGEPELQQKLRQHKKDMEMDVIGKNRIVQNETNKM